MNRKTIVVATVAVLFGWTLLVWPVSADIHGDGLEGKGDIVTGTVVFRPEIAPMTSTLYIGGETYFLPDGRFAIPLVEGVHDFTVRTWVGDMEGQIVYDRDLVHPDNELALMQSWAEGTGQVEGSLDDLNPLEALLFAVIWGAASEEGEVVGANGRDDSTIYFPEFDNWSRREFVRMLTSFSQTDATLRWPLFSDVPVWIDGNAAAAGGARTAAMDAFREWEEALEGAITFYEATRQTAESAGIVVLFQPAAEVKAQGGADAAGYCRVRQTDSAIVSGTIGVSQGFTRPAAVIKHEIGHCLGLGHSSHSDDVMFGTGTLTDTPLTDHEIDMVRLLYSLPRNTPAHR